MTNSRMDTEMTFIQWNPIQLWVGKAESVRLKED